MLKAFTDSYKKMLEILCLSSQKEYLRVVGLWSIFVAASNIGIRRGHPLKVTFFGKMVVSVSC